MILCEVVHILFKITTTRTKLAGLRGLTKLVHCEMFVCEALRDEFSRRLGSLYWGPFLEAPETFRARKAIFSSSVSKDGEVYTPETSCLKRTSFHIKNL